MTERQIDFQELREQAEALLDGSPDAIEALSPEAIRELLEGLCARQKVIEAQNDALRDARRELEIARNQFFRIFDRAPVGYLVIDNHGIIRQANATFAEMIGEAAADLGHKPFSNWLNDPDRNVFLSRFKAFFKKPAGKVMEIQIRSRSGRTFDARLEGRPEPLPTTAVGATTFNGLLLIVSDISDRKAAEDAREEVEHRYRLLFNETSDAIFLHDLSGRFLDVNDAAVERLGYSRQALLSMTPADIDAAEYAEKVPASIRKISETGQAIIETVHVSADGRRIPTELSCRVIDYGESRAVLSIARDITARKAAESALRENEIRFRGLAENIPVMVAAFDVRHDRFTFWNRRCESVTGYARDEMVDLPDPLATLYPDPAARQRVRRQWESAGARYIESENILTARDGGVRTIRWTYLPAALSDIEDTIWAMGIDLTDQLHADEALRFQADLLNQIRDWITATDLDGRITYVNESVRRSFGKTEEDLIGRHVSQYGEDPIQGATQAEILAATRSQGQWRGEVVNRIDGGETVILDSRTQLVRDSAGNPVGMVGISTDVTGIKRSEAALRESKERLELALSAADMGIWDWDLQTQAVDWSEEHAALFGISMDQFGGTIDDVQRIIHPDDREQGMAVLQGVLEESADFDNTYRVVWPDGTVRWLYSFGRLIRTPDGEPWRIIGTTQDITDRKTAEDALREKTRELDTFFNNSLDLLCIADVNGRFHRLNPEWENALGYPVHELEGRQFFDFIHPDDLAPTQEAVSTLSAEMPLLSFTNRYRHRDGSYRWIEWRSHPVEGTIYACARDITDRLRTERRARRLAEAVHQTSEAVMITDPDGVIEYVNPAFEVITGYPESETVGRTPRILKSGEQEPGFYADLWETITAGKIWSGRMVNRRKDGSLFTEDCTISPLRNDAGRIERFVAVKRDITRELELEEQFRQSQRLESVGRLAAGVAHDLNNLLSPILGYAELIQEDLDPSSRHFQPVRQIERAAWGARDLIQQLLAFGRKQLMEFRILDLRRVVERMEKLLRRTLRENISLGILRAPSPCPIQADAGQIGQVLMNLAVNAQDAMPRGGTLTIEVSPAALDATYCAVHTQVNPGPYAMMAVSDTGTGIDPEARKHIFEPFFTTKADLGTGLGLATVYGIVKQHGGHVWVYSELGRGTTFKVYLPLAGEAAEETVEAPAPASSEPPRETVLVAEDNEMVRRLACRILERRGYRVIDAENGRDTLKKMAGHDGPIHLLLTDVVMPDMDGKTLAGRVAETHPDLKVLFMSGYTENVIAHHSVLMEGVNFIQKPFSVRALIEKVREVLSE